MVSIAIPKVVAKSAPAALQRAIKPFIERGSDWRVYPNVKPTAKLSVDDAIAKSNA